MLRAPAAVYKIQLVGPPDPRSQHLHYPVASVPSVMQGRAVTYWNRS